jgi:3-methyladenine DNA glycosylase AlkC
MAEPFKNLVNREVVEELAGWLEAAGPLDSHAFVSDAMDGLEALELKDRVRHLSTVLHRHLEPDYRDALAHIVRALPPPLQSTKGVTSSIGIWPLCHFVESFGVDDPDASLPALYELTRRFSAEFAIRPFIDRWPEQTLGLLARWALDPDPHVRRLVSEGSRPRLPWGMRLQALVDDPSPLLPLLEVLRDDDEEYVRRSVANNLNDISKDNPDLVVEVCGRWLEGASGERRKLVRHALRTLVKAGHEGALEVLGFGPPAVEVDLGGDTEARIGSSVSLTLRLTSTADHEQSLVVDYAMHSPGARGRTNRKVFKWATRALAAGAEIVLRRQHSLRPVSTRRTLPGTYRFELLVNGRSLGEHMVEVSE